MAEFTATLPVPVAVKEKNKVPDQIQPILHSVSGVLPAYSKEQLSKLQQEDAAIGGLWNRKVQGWEEGHEEPNIGVGGVEFQGWLREYHRIKFHKGLLFRQLDDPILGVVRHLLVPEVLRDVLLESAHDKWGHQGFVRTYALLKQRCYWPGMNHSVKRHVQACAECVIALPSTFGPGEKFWGEFDPGVV